MLKDAILAYGQNGEAIRPEQGYPLRLILPGWEGNTHIKWLRRLELSDKPFMTREETSKYTDLMANGKARQFSFDMEAKSVITFPSGEMKLPGPGFYNISGLAWSGRGRVQSVDVSIDGGKTWYPARIGHRTGADLRRCGSASPGAGTARAACYRAAVPTKPDTSSRHWHNSRRSGARMARSVRSITSMLSRAGPLQRMGA